jgi:hypothetical protein
MKSVVREPNKFNSFKLAFPFAACNKSTPSQTNVSFNHKDDYIYRLPLNGTIVHAIKLWLPNKLSLLLM